MRLDGVLERGDLGARIVEVDAPPQPLTKIECEPEELTQPSRRSLAV